MLTGLGSVQREYRKTTLYRGYAGGDGLRRTWSLAGTLPAEASGIRAYIMARGIVLRDRGCVARQSMDSTPAGRGGRRCERRGHLAARPGGGTLVLEYCRGRRALRCGRDDSSVQGAETDPLDFRMEPRRQFLFGVSFSQHVRIEEHHGCRVIRRSCSHESVVFSGARSIASRHASRLTPRTSSGRCRGTRTNRSSPWRWMSKTSPGLAPGMTTRFLMSARTGFMGGDFTLVIASVNGSGCPGGAASVRGGACGAHGRH